MMRNNVQAAMTADRIRVSLDFRLLIEPAKAMYQVNNDEPRNINLKINGKLER